MDFVFEPGKTSSKFLIETMGGGVALFDADGDGKLDVFFVNGAELKPAMKATDKPDKSNPKFWNRLYRNAGNGVFVDITEEAGVRGSGYGQGVAVGDCDNDGRPDLFVTALGQNTLYRNKGNAEFEDITAQAGVAGSGWSTSAAFVDYDRDGNIDLFVTRYLEWDFSKNKRCGSEGPGMEAYCHPNEFAPITHLFYRGLGSCKFEDVSVKTQISRSPGKGLGIAIHDIDRDGWPDIYIANDSFPQQLFRNRGDGIFEEVALMNGAAYDESGRVFAGMGVDLADYNNDGLPDIFVNALANQGYALFKNTGSMFEYVSGSSGIATISKLHSGWGTRFLDFDNDGWKDLFVAQSHVMDNIELTQPGIKYSEQPLLLKNQSGRFTDVSSSSGSPFQSALIARGAAFGDIDNDGSVDIVISVLSDSPRVFRNTPTKNSWILIDTVGTVSNRDGIGASIRIVMPSGREQFGFVTTTGSYLSAHDKRVHFGLGTEQEIKLLEISWPSGIKQTWHNIASNQIFVAKEARQ